MFIVGQNMNAVKATIKELTKDNILTGAWTWGESAASKEFSHALRRKALHLSGNTLKDLRKTTSHFIHRLRHVVKRRGS